MGSRGARVANGQQRTRLAVDGDGLTCERGGAGVWPRASAGGEREGASHGGSAADLASSANSRRHGNPCVQLAAADEAGRARAERECLDIPGFGCLYPFAYTGRAREQHRVRTEFQIKGGGCHGTCPKSKAAVALQFLFMRTAVSSLPWVSPAGSRRGMRPR